MNVSCIKVMCTYLANRESSRVLPVTRSCCSWDIMVNMRIAASSYPAGEGEF